MIIEILITYAIGMITGAGLQDYDASLIKKFIFIILLAIFGLGFYYLLMLVGLT